MKALNAKLIKAIDPADLVDQVIGDLKSGRDMYAPLFVSNEGLLCQFTIPMLNIYEYRLIVADDLDDLEQQVVNLTALDFDFLFSTVQWHGKYLQWMSRMNETGVTVKEALVKTLIPAERGEEEKLVADVRHELGLEPTANYGIPYPIHQDAERIGASFLHSLGLDIPRLMVVGGVVLS